jgi:hypothetical protein
VSITLIFGAAIVVASAVVYSAITELRKQSSRSTRSTAAD